MSKEPTTIVQETKGTLNSDSVEAKKHHQDSVNFLKVELSGHC